MRISVVIPTYNGEKFITEAIDSVLNQTRAPYEILVSDDNSSDSTLDKCGKYGNRIKVFRNPDGPSGFVNGWNNGIAHASGDYICILHQDDLLSPEFIEKMEKAIYENPDVKHFFSPCSIIDDKGLIIRKSNYLCNGEIVRYRGEEYARAYVNVKGHIHRCPGVITHKSIFEKCKYRAEAGHIADDDFFLRVGNYTDVIGVLEPLAYYREHSASETGHLSLLKLNKRLLSDYHYQLSHADENPMLKGSIIETFRRWESEYIHRLIVYSLKAGKINYTLTGLKYWLLKWNGRRSGNILYDLENIPKRIKKVVRVVHSKHITAKSRKLKEIAKSNGNVLIVAPHPDDEVIGCGGLISRLVSQGNIPYIIIMTGGEGSHRGCCSISGEEIRTARRMLTRNALAILEIPQDHIHELDFPDGGIDAKHGQIKELKKIIRDISPKSVFVPHWGEGWHDHVSTAEIVKSILPKTTGVYEYCVWMWYYNVWCGLDWKNAYKLALKPEEHSKKLKALDTYVKPMAPCGKPWSGALPKVFLDAHKGNVELYFKVR